MSAFDVQVKKVLDTWNTKVPWQSGTDAELLQEFYEVYQKWGMMTLIPAFSAASHIFGQDAHKAALVDTALQEVAALRKAVKEAESKAEETKETPGGPGKDITKEMVLEKVKENQNIRLQQAQAVVQGLEAELMLTRSTSEKQNFDAALAKARDDRLLCSQQLTLGWAGYAQKEIQEAMQALTTATNTQSLDYLDSLLAAQQKKAAHGTPMTQAEALKLLKITWNQLVRAVILQNGQKGVGAVKLADTEKTPRGKQALTSLAHDELSETIKMKCMEGESIEGYTCRLQQRERYVRWMISVLLQSAEEVQVLQLADTQFFKLLKVALPETMRYMGHASFEQGFSVLASSILESTAGITQNSTPKKVGFAAVASAGKLSRQPRNVINDETRVDAHNKKVTTTHRPKPPRQQEDDEQPSSEEEMEVTVRKLMAEVKQLKEKKSPTKSHKSASRDDDVDDDGQEFAQGKRAVLISLLKEIQGKFSDNKKGPTNECFAFIKTGACRRGDDCRFEHPEGDDIPPPYPASSPKRHRSDSPRSTQGERDCETAKRTGVCRDSHCPDYHGQFDDRAVEMCRYIQDGRPCYRQWLEMGCAFNHIAETRQDRRHERGGSSRADRFRG